MNGPPKQKLNLLWGAEAIARELGVTNRQAFHMLEQGHIPARKVGGRWCSDQDKLHAHFRGDADDVA
jgi:hypothetical protein